jgi:Methyltransferase domain
MRRNADGSEDFEQYTIASILHNCRLFGARAYVLERYEDCGATLETRLIKRFYRNHFGGRDAGERTGVPMNTVSQQVQNGDQKDSIASYLSGLREVEDGATFNIPFDVQDKSVGFSGKKLLASLQRLAGLSCAENGTCYLEVGTYRGLTLLSVASANSSVPCYGIDNFAQHDHTGMNETLIRQRAAKFNITNANLIITDFEDALMNLDSHIGKKQVGCYLVDGPHDYRSQLVCLTLARKWLAPRSIIFIDDSNYEHVRQANKDFLLAFPEFKLLFEAYGPAHPDNLDADGQRKVRDGYWDGVNILVHDPENELEAIYPPTSTERTRYVNDHIVHSSPIAEAAPEALHFATAFSRPWRIPRAGFRLFKKLRNRSFDDRYRAANTYSAEAVNYGVLRRPTGE